MFDLSGSRGQDVTDRYIQSASGLSTLEHTQLRPLVAKDCQATDVKLVKVYRECIPELEHCLY
jgi:hypothetical protein